MSVSTLSEVCLTELIYKPFALRRFLDDALLIVLSYGATELVIVHGWSILSLSPIFGHLLGVVYLEHT